MTLLLALLILLPFPRLRAEEPKFTSGELGALSCKVVKEERAKSGSCRLLIEVTNGGEHSVEPLEFRLRQTPKKKKKAQAAYEFRTARASFPFANRYGRAVPPKGKERYWLQTGVYGNDEMDFEIGVTRASWFDGASAPRPALAAGKITPVEQRTVDGRKVDVSRVRIDNPGAVEIDAIFLATIKEPRDEQVLLGVRVPPGGIDWVISDIRSQITFEQEAPSAAVRVEKLELVDWCLVGAADPALAAKQLETAYRAWVQWTPPWPGLTGRLRFSAQAQGGVDNSAVGTFVLDASGTAQVEFDPAANKGVDGEALRSMAKVAAVRVRRAFADLQRAPFETLRDKNALREIGDGAVEIEGPGFAAADTSLDVASAARRDPSQTQNLTVADGIIVADGDRKDFARHRWSTRPMAGGYVVTRRSSPAGDWCFEFSYAELDGRVVPTGYREYWGTVAGELLSQHTLLFSDVRFDKDVAPVVPTPPSGPGATALRAAWDNGYRYPKSGRELRAKFEVRTPGTDLTWQGLRELKGSFVLQEFHGFLMSDSGWSGWESDFSTALGPVQKRALGFAVYDRLILWSGRDFNGRPDFDAQFDGCTIAAATADGRYEIKGGPIAGVVVRDGRVVELALSEKMQRRFTWTKIGDAQIVTRVQTGAEDLNVKFANVDGTLLPVEFDFKAVFGADWGPEHIRLADVGWK